VDKTFVWAGVAIVSVVTICVTVLAALDRDTTALLGVVTAVAIPTLAALGWGKLTGIEKQNQQQQQQTNGTQTKMLSMLEHAMNQLAQAPPQDGPKKPADGPRT